MKKHVLALLAFLVLIPSAQLLTQEPVQPRQPTPAAPAAPTLETSAAAQTPDGTALLPETRSCEQPEVPSDLPPVSWLGSSCSSNSDCPSNQLCCNLCGNPPDDGSSCLSCAHPVRGRCPRVV